MKSLIPEMEYTLRKIIKKQEILKQETGIIKNEHLKWDFIKRKKKIDLLRVDMNSLEK